MEEQNQHQISPEEIEKEQNITLAARAVNEALGSLNIPKLTDDSEFPNPRWDVFFQGEGKETVLTIRFHPSPAAGWLHVPVVTVVWIFLMEVKAVLSDPKAAKMLISDKADYDYAVYDTIKQFAINYIAQLPTVMFHAFHQTVSEALISQIKKFIEPDLREHWQKLDMPKKFSLIPDNNLSAITKLFPDVDFLLLNHLDLIDKEFSVYRKWALSDRKVWLNSQARANLPAEHERLKVQYGEMKDAYKELRPAFFKVHRRAEEEDWDKHWEEFCDETFPDLSMSNAVKDYSAAELAYRHLAQFFDISPTYMPQMVGGAREQTKENALGKSPDNL